MRVGIIINPVAGGARRRTVRARTALARRMLAEHGLEGTVCVTEHPGHARELTRGLLDRGAETVVAWGGDGTVNEVASQLAFGEAALGIVAAGSGNGLARELGLPWRARRALETALAGEVQWIDAGELGGRLLFNVGGIGFDAVLAERVNAAHRRGASAYFTAGVRTLLRYRPQLYTVRIQQQTVSQPALVVAVANTRQYGNRALIAPRARLDDGWLDVVLVPALSLPATLWHARRMFTGTIDRVPGVRILPAQAAEISAPEALTFHVDGEVVHGAASLSAVVHPRALTVRVSDRRRRAAPAAESRRSAGPSPRPGP